MDNLGRGRHPRTDIWDERALLLLGVLMTQEQHAYQINDFIERSLCRVTTMKKSTAYALLDRLATAGLVSLQREQVGNRPPRKVYAITPDGRTLFFGLLQENLATVDEPTLSGDVGLMLLNYLDRTAALSCLKERLRKLDALLAGQVNIPRHGGKLRLDLALDHLLTLRRADRDWLATTISRLEHEEALAAEAGPAESPGE